MDNKEYLKHSIKTLIPNVPKTVESYSCWTLQYVRNEQR